MQRSARGARSKAAAKVWFHIFVKLPRGLMTSLRVHADMTVGELQSMVEEASGIPCDVQTVTTTQNGVNTKKEVLLGQLGLRAGSTVSVCPAERWREVFNAAMMGDYWLVRRCLDGTEGEDTRSEGRFCAAFLAAHRGHLDLLQRLLGDGQDVNRKTVGGRSVLDIASARGHTQCVNALLGYGAESDLPNGHDQRAVELSPAGEKQQGAEELPTFRRKIGILNLETHDEIKTDDKCNRKAKTDTLDAQMSSSIVQKSGDLIAPPSGQSSPPAADPKRHRSQKEEKDDSTETKRGGSDDDEVFVNREENGQTSRADRLKVLSRVRSAGRRSSAPVVSGLANRPSSAAVGRVKTWGGSPQPRVNNLRRGSESSEADDSLAPLPGVTQRRHLSATITADAASILKSTSSKETADTPAPPNSPRHAFIGFDSTSLLSRPRPSLSGPRPSLSGRRLTGLRRGSLPVTLPSTGKSPTSPNQKKTFEEWLGDVEERKKFEEEQKMWDHLQDMHEQALREEAKYKRKLSFDDWNRQKARQRIQKMEGEEEDKSEEKERRQKTSQEEYQKWVLRKEHEELEKERQKQKEAEKDYQRWLKLKEELQEVENKLGRVALRPKSTTQRGLSLQTSLPYAART